MTRWRKYLGLSLLLTSSHCFAISNGTISNRLAEEIQAGKFSGSVLIARGDHIIHQQSTGIADQSTGRLHSQDDVWRWASVSKQITAVLVMQDIEAGKYQLDSSMASLLPEFKTMHAQRLTIQQLLQHTSGLPNPDNDTPDANGVPAFYSRDNGTAGTIPAALEYCALPAREDPGISFEYNNCDTLVLQAVLEKMAGMAFSKILQSRLQNTILENQIGGFDANKSHLPITAIGYQSDARAEPFYQLANFGAAGAIYGSAHNLWQFDLALMRGQLLGPKALNELWAGKPELGYAALGAWSYKARLPGCETPVALVERRGAIGGIQVRNLMAPALEGVVIIFSNTSLTEFGEIWQGTGLLHDLASAAFCQIVQKPTP